ncbi:MAG: hypothetical protein ACRDP1_02045 [Nocardioidaceae bacterium]
MSLGSWSVQPTLGGGATEIRVVARVARALRLDIVAVSQSGHSDSAIDDAANFPESLAAALAESPYVVLQSGHTTGLRDGWGDPGAPGFTTGDALLLRCDADAGLTVVDVDAGSYAACRRARSGWLAVDLERAGARLRLVVTHWDSRDIEVRAAQADELVKVATEYRGRVLLSVGGPAPTRGWLMNGVDDTMCDDPGLEALVAAGFTDVSAMNAAVAGPSTSTPGAPHSTGEFRAETRPSASA